jgi:SAM-dependent methyltransferase
MGGDGMRNEAVPCNLCGRETFSPVLSDPETGFSQGFCQSCGLIYVNPRLDGPSRARFYETYGQKYPETFLLDPKNPYLQIARARAAFFAGFLRRLSEKPRTLLEVGSSYGFFLRELDKRNVGIQTYGLDPSSTEVEFARRVNRLSNVRTGVVEDLRGGKERFDVVALFHVLEHLGDPMTTLHNLSDSLRDGGLLWIEVPDAAELKGDVIEFQHFISCQHLYEFSQTTLKALLERAGFEEVLHEKAPLGFFLESNQRAIYRKKEKRVNGQMRVDTNAEKYLALFRDRIIKIRDDVQSWCSRQADRGTPIFIYGGGFHTMGLLRLIGYRNGSVQAILDDDETKQGNSLDGLPILSPSVLKEQSQVAVLISTLVGEEAILRQLSAVRKAGWEIKTIYRGVHV